MISGFRKALELGAQIIIKLDGDGQINYHAPPRAYTRLPESKADSVKGNRFRDFQSLQQMPFIRRFRKSRVTEPCTKAATGYWNIFDPTNGFFLHWRGNTCATSSRTTGPPYIQFIFHVFAFISARCLHFQCSPFLRAIATKSQICPFNVYSLNFRSNSYTPFYAASS